MNAILLGAAALGTLAAMYSSPMSTETLQDQQNRGWMIHQVQVDPQTGDTTVIDSIGFKD